MYVTCFAFTLYTARLSFSSLGFPYKSRAVSVSFTTIAELYVRCVVSFAVQYYSSTVMLLRESYFDVLPLQGVSKYLDITEQNRVSIYRNSY